MKARRTYAGATLAKQVQAKYKNALIVDGDKDGLGVFRSMSFDPVTARWLEPIIRVIRDNRILEYLKDPDTDELVVIFSTASSVADQRHDFAIEAVDKVLNEPEVPAKHASGVEADVPLPKKRVVKKRAAHPEAL